MATTVVLLVVTLLEGVLVPLGGGALADGELALVGVGQARKFCALSCCSILGRVDPGIERLRDGPAKWKLGFWPRCPVLWVLLRLARSLRNLRVGSRAARPPV